MEDANAKPKIQSLKSEISWIALIRIADRRAPRGSMCSNQQFNSIILFHPDND